MERNIGLGDSKALLIRSKENIGSGFFITEGLIATNIHVVAKSTPVSAELVDTNTVFTVDGVAAFDAKNDLVILKSHRQGNSTSYRQQ